MSYRIESFDGGEWRDDAIGNDNTFDTREDALDGVDALRALGPEWEYEADEETGEPNFETRRQYRVVEV